MSVWHWADARHVLTPENIILLDLRAKNAGIDLRPLPLAHPHTLGTSMLDLPQ
jgi:hypothetical protein